MPFIRESIILMLKEFDNFNILNILSIIGQRIDRKTILILSSHAHSEANHEEKIQDQRDLRHLRCFQGNTISMGERETDLECGAGLAQLASLHR
jgi:hypothetical protein